MPWQLSSESKGKIKFLSINEIFHRSSHNSGQLPIMTAKVYDNSGVNIVKTLEKSIGKPLQLPARRILELNLKDRKE